jgi:hypothetical protein
MCHEQSVERIPAFSLLKDVTMVIKLHPGIHVLWYLKFVP